MELARYLKGLISKRYFTLEDLNRSILHTNILTKLIASSNTHKFCQTRDHENHALLRLLPLLIGSKVPERDTFWEVLMDLKDVVQLTMSHSDETIQYMACKILDHRQLFQEVFPNVRFRPKHHYIEHYPHLIKCFGPLVHLWTMRFEGKQKVFK